MAAQQLCTPASLYGPFDRYLFCGCSVKGVQLSGGLNDQQGEITVQLVQDCDSTDERKYYDELLNLQTTTDADPGFTNPSIGAPAYFRLGDFEFAGLVQSYTEGRDQNGDPSYSIKLVDPRQILDSVQVIVDEYAGSVNGVYNLINAFGYMESFGNPCPQISFGGASWGTPAGGFGGANVNNNGMQWNRLKDALHILTGAFPAVKNVWSPEGRLMFLGAVPSTNGYGVIQHDDYNVAIPSNFPNHTGYLAQYILDLTELPTAPATWRISGTNVSVLDIVRQVCEAAGCDYYISLDPVKHGGGVQKIIKVRTISRVSQPLLGEITNFIGTGDGVEGQQVGQELRSEPTTKFLFGGNKKSLYQAVQNTNPESGAEPSPSGSNDVIQPFWGLDSGNNAILSSGTRS